MQYKTVKILLLATTVLLTGGLSVKSVHAMAHATAHPAAHPAVHATPHATTHTATHTTTHETTHANHTATHEAHTTHNKTTKSTNNKSVNTTVKFNQTSPTQKSKLINNSHHYTTSQANKVFNTNNINSTYRRYYYRQSVISNPWFWMFMINHHRINTKHSNNEQYLRGYRTGHQMGEKDLKDHNRNNQKLTTDQEKQYSQSWQNGYYDGYNNAILNK